ncbi:type II secretion system F family protein [Butyrivibrio sp. FC2001]|uniref:type II secretion system F family protein n=1 Tax=Butyrivibrio sp. FC2001 TaxID=1280671 RepID=UPI0004272047|nr:type II secretion system F family protein [Butyrivibrio sp. FC2001]
MFLSVKDYIFFGLAILSFGFWLYLFFLGKKYQNLFDGLEEKEYPMKDLYGMGYAFLELIHYPYRFKWDRKLKNYLGIMYTDKYVEYYIRVIYSQTVTIVYTAIVLAIFYGTYLGETSQVFTIGFLGVALGVYFVTLPKIKIDKRSEELITDYAEVVTNLALLTNAGMILREAWTEVAYASNDEFYLEMQKVVDDLNNGIGETQAYTDFGIRCVIPEAKKFASTIIQGIQKGNKELSMNLQEQSAEVWEQKKQLVKRKGEKAANRLIIPVFVMFIGIIIMVIVPIFANLF